MVSVLRLNNHHIGEWQIILNYMSDSVPILGMNFVKPLRDLILTEEELDEVVCIVIWSITTIQGFLYQPKQSCIQKDR